MLRRALLNEKKEITSSVSENYTTEITQNGEKNIYAEHIENVHINNNIEYTKKTISDEENLYPKNINLNYYNLFVVEESNFCFNNMKDIMHLSKQYTDGILIEAFQCLDGAIKKKIKSFPLLIVPVSEYEYGKGTCEQYAYVGFIDSIDSSHYSNEIEWHLIKSIPLNHIRSWAERLDIKNMDKPVSEFNVPHWAIKQADLLNVLTNTMLLEFPTMHGKDTMLPVITKEYLFSEKALVLHFTNYYYSEDKSENVSKICKILKVKLNKLPIYRNCSEIVVLEFDVNSYFEFFQTLPGLPIINTLIEKCDISFMLIPPQRNGILCGDNHKCELVEEKDSMKTLSFSDNNLQSEDITDLIDMLWEKLLDKKFANNKNELELLEQIKLRY